MFDDVGGEGPRGWMGGHAVAAAVVMDCEHAGVWKACCAVDKGADRVFSEEYSADVLELDQAGTVVCAVAVGCVHQAALKAPWQSPLW